MIVIGLTTFVGLALVSFFVLLFICLAAKGDGPDHEALLPFEDEQPRPAREKIIVRTRR
ncbi:MAG TPA: hypothetical protein VHY22_18195 [Chthoniobacteraceae bacterium]|jgi:hypothetical protein|nr:hypothetical protein [Chthoniobacteraceae bacterium]